jgi:hypothetical protein
MRSTFQNTGTALSIGVFFSLMIAGLSSTLPRTLFTGLRSHGVAPAVAHRIAGLPPVSSLFAAVLGDNPIAHLLGSGGTSGALTPGARAVLTGRAFFPRLIAGPFHDGLVVVFLVGAGLSLLAAIASGLRGGRSTPAPPRPRPAGEVPLPAA